MAERDKIPVTVRSFRKSDAQACKVLYADGLLGGTIASNDTGLDIEDIEAAYMRSSGGHFWVAEDESSAIVGMIGVHQHEQGEGEIRRLRVLQSVRRRGVGTALLERALKHCHDMQYLKVTLDTFMQREPAIALFQKFGFKLDRQRDLNGKTLMYFYLDLYSRPHREQPP